MDGHIHINNPCFSTLASSDLHRAVLIHDPDFFRFYVLPLIQSSLLIHLTHWRLLFVTFHHEVTLIYSERIKQMSTEYNVN